VKPDVRKALLRFRVMAFVVGTGLLVLVAALVRNSAFATSRPVEVVGPIHGFLYMVYVLTALDLAFRLRWPLLRIALVVLAGTIPFVSFYAEHRVTTWVRTEESVPTEDSGLV
jgi:integral membrane protein